MPYDFNQLYCISIFNLKIDFPLSSCKALLSGSSIKVLEFFDSFSSGTSKRSNILFWEQFCCPINQKPIFSFNFFETPSYCYWFKKYMLCLPSRENLTMVSHIYKQSEDHSPSMLTPFLRRHVTQTINC